MILACGACGGILESGAIAAVLSCSVGLTHLWNRLKLARHIQRERQYLQNLAAIRPRQF